MSDEWRPEQYDPAAHQQRINRQQPPSSHVDPQQDAWQATRPYGQPPQQDPWQASQAYGQPPYSPQQPYGQPPQQPGWPTAQHQVQYRPSSGPGGGGKRNRRKLNGILLGVIGVVVLLFIIGLATGGGKSGSTGNTSPTASTTASPVSSVAGNAVKTLPTTKKTPPKATHTAVAPSQAAAPSVPVQTTHAAAPAPPASTAPASCHPLTNGGNCYQPGEYCRNSDHGISGVAGDGEAIICEDKDGWRWERA